MNDGPDDLLSPRTLAARGPLSHDTQSRALTPPIEVATTYIRDADNGYPPGRVYGRPDNASVQHAEAQIAALENARAAMLFNSGMAAAAAVFMALDPTHVVVPARMFWGLQHWLRGIGRHGHMLTAVDMADAGAVRRAIRPGRTGLVWIETPSNPLWTITDVAVIAACARDAGAVLCADSTVATPILTRPLDLGADMVMHSATKYLNGHSDVVAGVLAVRRPGALWSRIRDFRSQQGAVIGPFDAWLLARGLKTLDLRVREQSRGAALLAARLAAHPAIAAVLYPGLPCHPGHDVARRQMVGGFGGMLSIRLRGGAAQAIGVAARVALWQRATSFGGVESLIEHRASIEGEGSLCPDDLLRLSVGLEDPEDLHRDLLRALEATP